MLKRMLGGNIFLIMIKIINIIIIKMIMLILNCGLSKLIMYIIIRIGFLKKVNQNLEIIIIQNISHLLILKYVI